MGDRRGNSRHIETTNTLAPLFMRLRAVVHIRRCCVENHAQDCCTGFAQDCCAGFHGTIFHVRSCFQDRRRFAARLTLRTVGFFRHYIGLIASFILRGNLPIENAVCDGVNGTIASQCSLLANENSGVVRRRPGSRRYGSLHQPGLATHCLDPR